ncbi:conserved hypothetical protein [Histoplasma mississippiense (nom. inval.)]|uniref:conserved hypothetical protein n=1 Tax=Ajellomyces capsulatus (strain NAm1 / WU24) TaxID=2059318 RepID=UPI000157D1B8|nr:conserved hypothetical protein [Histoplasma mississippiense (nom. inval.)]EDN04338.1 conserved hypothetical protein [Histoplasma mississippiense (nom. inval.)]
MTQLHDSTLSYDWPAHPNHRCSLTPQHVQVISGWLQQSAQSIHSDGAGVNPTARVPGTSVSLAIPLDEEHTPLTSLPLPVRTTANGDTNSHVVSSATYSRREPLRRDSLKRRDALLKGKEGSRRRQRWENDLAALTRRLSTIFLDSSARFPDRLLHNPWAQPPSAIDWQVQPTYQRRTVPYYLAPLWDSHFAAREQAKSSNKPLKANHKDGSPVVQSQIPKDLRLKLKHARAARGLLRDLEEKIRLFVQRYYEKQVVSAQDEDEVELDGAPSLLSDEERWEKLQDKAETETETEKECDSDDDEIVFVGRKGRMLDASANHNRTTKIIHPDVDRPAKEEVGEKMVFESLEGDRAAGFGRWLVHSLASYYGLRTWSVTVGNPARREAYVGINHPQPAKQQRQQQNHRDSLPSTMPGNNSSPIPAVGRHVAKAARGQPDDILPQPLWVAVGVS